MHIQKTLAHQPTHSPVPYDIIHVSIYTKIALDRRMLSVMFSSNLNISAILDPFGKFQESTKL